MKRKDILDSMPQGLERAILSILLFRVGEENRISKQELMSNLAISGFSGNVKNLERKIRVAVSQLRKKGELICSNSAGRGYWIARDFEDAQSCFGEMLGRGTDILETARAMEKTATEQYTQQTPRFLNSTGII